MKQGNLNDENIISQLNGKISGLRFQPLHTLKHGFAVAHEILCDFTDGQHPEKGIQQMTEGERLSLFILQVTISLKRRGVYLLNLSASLLASKKYVSIIAAMKHHGRLIIELQDPDYLPVMSQKKRKTLAENIAVLQNSGWQVWLDDWKEEIDVFTLLPGIRFDGVKLDKSLAIKPNLSALVETAHRMASAAVIEGVETNEILFHAKKSGAELGQGYLWPQRRVSFDIIKQI